MVAATVKGRKARVEGCKRCFRTDVVCYFVKIHYFVFRLNGGLLFTELVYYSGDEYWSLWRSVK